MMQPKLLTETLPSERLVSVYNDPDLLRELVALWLTKNLSKGGGAMVVCTAESWLTIGNRLRVEGFDPDALQEQGQLRIVDAQRFLSDFLTDGGPEPDVYHHQVARVQKAVTPSSPSAEVGVWNEAIDLLRENDEPWAAEFLESLRLETTDPNTVHLVSPVWEENGSHLDALEKETEWVPYIPQGSLTMSIGATEANEEVSEAIESPSESN